MKKSLYYYTSLFAWGVVFLLIVFYAFAWNPPTDNPPNANLPAPINTSSVEQTKTGNLNLGGLLRLGLLTSHPTGTNGAIYYNTTDNKFYGYQNNEWKELGSGGGASFWLASGDNIYNTNTGNVGIGTTSPQTKLDVAGAIKIGSEATCNANTAGAIKYDSSAKKFYGCNGDSWLSLDQQSCGGSVTFNYKGSIVTYGTVYNPATGRCWMDRNLGASQVATAYNDANAYGDLFQWGRLDDGHQTRTSGTTTTLSSTDVPGHSNFIKAPASPYDWRSPQNNNLWQGVSGTNNPCPSGWRIPTDTEWDTERLSWSQQNYYGAYASPLKLTPAGRRDFGDGSFYGVGSVGYYWSSTVLSDANNARLLNFDSSNAYMNGYFRAYGFSVRCLKD